MCKVSTWNFQELQFYRRSNFLFSYWFLHGPYNSSATALSLMERNHPLTSHNTNANMFRPTHSLRVDIDVGHSDCIMQYYVRRLLAVVGLRCANTIGNSTFFALADFVRVRVARNFYSTTVSKVSRSSSGEKKNWRSDGDSISVIKCTFNFVAKHSTLIHWLWGNVTFVNKH